MVKACRKHEGGSFEDKQSELRLHTVHHSQQIRQDTYLSFSSALLFDQKGNSALTGFS